MGSLKYYQVTDGESYSPQMRGHRIQCCSCGLVHKIDFYVTHWGRGHKVKMRVFRDERATAAGRRKRIKREK